jgi:hypothetical protein
MPGAGKTSQAVVATRRLENSLHASIMTIVHCLCKTMAAARSAGGSMARLVAKCRAIWHEIFRLVDDEPIGNKNIATELPTILELSNVARVTPPGAEPYSTEGHNRQSTHADTPPCGISSCSKRPIWHNIRSCPNSRVVPGTSVLANLNARCPGVSNEVSSDWSPVGVSELPTCGLRSI